MSDELSYEERFKHTLIDFLSIEGETDLVQMLSQCEIVEKPQWAYTNVSGQKGMKIEIKVPSMYVAIIEEKYRSVLYNACKRIYKDDSSYGFTDIDEIGVVLLSTVKTVNHLTQEVSYLQNHANFQNLMNKVSTMNLEEDQKLYIYEACNSAISGNNIAAMVTLGCATELLFIKTCDAYKNYLLDIGEEAKAERFTNKVINAKVAYTRVNEFYKLVESDESMQIFSQYGLENIRIQFNFLDIIRQVRNESGHPTGKRISNEDLSTMFGNFQHLIEKLDKFIKDYEEEPLPF